MKVLLVNGSPHEKGCTYTALTEVCKTLNEEGIDTEIFWIGIKPISGCIACKKCAELGKCVFNDTVNEFVEKAKEAGFDGIELDVHTSADGELIVMHDETVDRVTDGTGLIKDMTLAQLKELKVSTPAEPTGIYRVPTLAEVLDLMRTTDMMVNIELKNSICFYPGMEEKILKLVKEMNMEDQLIYSSFNHYSLLQLKQLDDHVQTGILFSDGWINPAMYAKNLGINAVHPAVYHLKYPQFMEEVKRAGLKMHVWTANKPEHIQLVKDSGAEAVITNYPDRALEIVQK